MPYPDIPKIAVIIVNYNGGEYLARCLQAVRNQIMPVWRAIVVDNASTQVPIIGNEDWLVGIELIRLESNIGFAAANNLAVKTAEGAEWLALLNPDAFPEPDWLTKLIQAAERFPQYSSFASRMLFAENPNILDGAGDNYYASGRAKRRGHGQHANGRYLEYDEVFSPCAGAALYKKSAFDQVGGFDEDFFCYLEDVDLGFRLRLTKHRCLYVPDAVVLHVGSGLTGRHSDFSTYHGHRNLIWVFVKNMPSILFWPYLPLHLAMNISSLFICAGRGQGLLSLKAKLDALKLLPNMLKKRHIIQAVRVDVWAVRNIMKCERFRLGDL